MDQNFNFAHFSKQCRKAYFSKVPPAAVCLQQLYNDCEEVLDRYHPDRSARLACRAGCGDCCIVNVSLLLPEALAIVDYCNERPQKYRELDQKLDSLWISIRGVDDEERVCMRQPCVFLDCQGRCTIYPVRPLLCRGVTSTDTEECKKSFNAYLYNEKRSVQMNLFQHELYMTAYLGLGEGLEDRGMDGRGFELTGIVRYLRRHSRQRQKLQAGLRLRWEELA